MVNRTKRIDLRVTAKELNLIRKRMEEAGISSLKTSMQKWQMQQEAFLKVILMN